MKIKGVALFAVALALGSAQAAREAPSDDEARLLDLVNLERTSRGLLPLKWDPTLAMLARGHAADMRAAGRISHHSSRDGALFSQRLARTAVRASASAENVAFDQSVERSHRGLMGSPGHRANILNGELTAVGIGLAPDRDSEGVYVVEDFARLIPSMTDAEAASAIREALGRAARGTRPVEDEALSRQLRAELQAMVVGDSVRAERVPLDGPGWVFSYTSMDPSHLPPEARRRAGRTPSYGLAVSFRRTPSYPFGVYWVVLAIKGAS